jgi:hypothetical protein
MDGELMKDFKKKVVVYSGFPFCILLKRGDPQNCQAGGKIWS